MADESSKSLKIGAKVDVQSFKAFTNAVGDVKKLTDGLNKSLVGVNKVLKDLTKEFKANQRSIEDSTRALRQYLATLQGFVRIGGGGGLLPPGRGLMGGMPGWGSGGGERYMGWAQRVSGPSGGGYGGLPPGGPPPLALPPGFNHPGPRGVNWPPLGGGGFNARTFSRIAGFGASAMFLGANVADQYQRYKTLPWESAGRVAGAKYGDIGKRILGGDISDIIALRQLRAEGTDPYKQAGGQGAMLLGAGLRVGGGMAAGAAAGAALAGIPSLGIGLVPGALVGGGIGALFGVSTLPKFVTDIMGGDIRAREQENVMKLIRERVAMSPLQQASAALLMSQAPALMQAGRRLGGEGEASRMAGIGVKAGMMPQESWQFFGGLADQFGPEAARMAGTRAVQLQRFGLDRNVVGGGIGQLQSLLGGPVGGRTTAATKEIEDAVSAGVSRGITTPQTLEKLIDALVSARSGPMGPGTMGVGGARDLFNFLLGPMTGKTANPMEITQTLTGMQQIGQGTLGNPLLSAIDIAKIRHRMPGISGVAAYTLANTPMDQLLTGNRALDTLFGDPNDPGSKQSRARVRSTGREEFLAKIESAVGLSANEFPEMQNIMTGAGGVQGALKSERFRRLAGVTIRPLIGMQNMDDVSFERLLEHVGQGFDAGDLTGGGGRGFEKKLKPTGGIGEQAAIQQAAVALKAMYDAMNDPETRAAIFEFTKMFTSMRTKETISGWARDLGVDDPILEQPWSRKERTTKGR